MSVATTEDVRIVPVDADAFRWDAEALLVALATFARLDPSRNHCSTPVLHLLYLLKVVEMPGITATEIHSLVVDGAFSKATQTTVVDALEAAGLVTRAPDLADRRKFLIFPTSNGELLIKAALRAGRRSMELRARDAG